MNDNDNELLVKNQDDCVLTTFKTFKNTSDLLDDQKAHADFENGGIRVFDWKTGIELFLCNTDDEGNEILTAVK